MDLNGEQSFTDEVDLDCGAAVGGPDGRKREVQMAEDVDKYMRLRYEHIVDLTMNLLRLLLWVLIHS